jgi:serine/threonine-protein kinase
LGDAYRIERELGGGGMSRLFLATEASLRRQVVIKLLPPEFASDVSSARFQQEIQLAAHLQHPNILPVLTAGAKDDLLFYVMPFVPGESLRHRLTREGKLPVADAVRIVHEVADALAHAHAEGVIHRDIKPENILLEGGHAVLTDFGVARALSESRSGGRLTDTGLALGTPGYMSPEQAAGERNIDARADVYALAVVSYEMLAGFPPFAGPTAQAVIAAHLTATPKPLSDVRPETPPHVANTIAHALARDPNARLRTAAQFRDGLGSVLGPPARPRFSRGARLAAGVAGLMGLVAAVVLFARSRGAAALDRDLVAVAPFTVLDPKLALWGEGLVDILSRNLDGAGQLRTVSPTLVVRRWSGRADPSTAADLGRRTGAGLVVFGQLVNTRADSVRLTATLLDVGSRRSIGEVEVRDVNADMDRLADSLTFALLRELGRSRAVGAVRRSAVGAASLPALKAFLQGEQFFRRTAWDSAIAYYERAVALDTGFALALNRMGTSLGWQRTGTDSLANAYWLRAGAHNRGLAPRDSILVAADSLSAVLYRYPADTAWWAHARRLTATLADATRRYPDDPLAWYALGDARYHFLRIMGATDQETLDPFDRALALDSAFAPAYIHPVELALDAGGPSPARRYLAAYLGRDPTDVGATAMRLVERLLDQTQVGSSALARTLDTISPDVLVGAGAALRLWPDSTEIGVRLARMTAASPRDVIANTDPAYKSLQLARALGYRGHLREAYSIGGARFPAYFAGWALLGAVPDDSAAAAFGRWVDADLPQAGLAMPWLVAHTDTVSLHQYGRRMDSLNRASSHVWERDRARYLADAARAFLALARRDTADALRRLAVLPDSACPFCVSGARIARAVLLEARRQDRAAAPLLQQFLGPYMAPTEGLRALLRGRVNERLGNRAAAVAAYRFVAAVWRNADPELQSYVAEARAALKRLSGEPR